ncbi:probable serine/threonine-protein kinase PkwA [Penaeus indicus]|uniref:probable serine/threonine-protein kinase PkwA n=1 Tax=Penaeus indicus TaxID=29960 RepID=UPI00300CA5A7
MSGRVPAVAQLSSEDLLHLQTSMLVRRLGEGGSAKVDLVRWGKGVACLKVAKCEYNREEFLREADILHLVGGAGGAPHLLAIAEHPPALLVSFRGYRTFHSFRSLRPPDLTYLHVLWSLAECVAEIHTAGVVHTDLKPDNVMVTLPKRADGFVKVRIVDFGHGRLAGEYPVIYDGLCPGRYFWVSPEALGGGRISPASDVYSLGVLMKQVSAWMQDSPPTLTLLAARATRPRPGDRCDLREVRRGGTFYSRYIDRDMAKYELNEKQMK